MTDRKRVVRARVFGTVQGVSYRVWARREAERLGVTGWVRNEGDGSVTAFVAGADTAVDAMIERLWQGPRGALVSAVETEEVAEDAPAGFRIIA
ncbi:MULTISPECIES: acylphosphatase [unclassified Mesorhizobium]|uniref:acylphosphatase n=1 Tax=unclassified Mesorhizobium TaxID=325217 RepID=UPI000F76157D|nr:MULTISPECIES: acylphosphatase [unclassified Mesorhizobium]AZO31367.1 acylphosphatase [Mesorhizobium sp. M1B.F.Ca.ET.045.04.1.1]RWE00342.1 MAG: acylphosphatase [Mesorhizobium sp.]